MPNIVGLSALYHDSAAAVIVDGRIVAAAQEERFTRLKADASFPHFALQACLDQSGLTPSDIDAVGFYEIPGLKFERLIDTFLAGAPRGFQPFLAAIPSWLSTKLQVRQGIRQKWFSGHDVPIHFCPHHLSHAASAFYPSPFESAAVLTIDGVGEWATASIMHGQGSRLRPIVEQRFPHSLGLLYSAITSYCGFEMNSGEYKLMGLAAYGVPRFVEILLRDVVRLEGDGSIHLDQEYFDYCFGMRMTSSRFHQLVGRKPRRPEETIGELDCDLAASVQAITEMAMTRMASHACRLTGERTLCLAGGVALNCVAVAKLIEENIVDHVWVQPASGDAGGAVGVGLWLAHQKFGSPRNLASSSGSPQASNDFFRGAFLGPSFSPIRVEQTIKDSGLDYTDLKNDDALCHEVARLISMNAIVGWFQGAMEFGPRALGHRSILADPRDAQMKDRVNRAIKHRDPFRPFAPAVLERLAAEYFAIQMSAAYPYMTQTCRVLRPDILPAVTHVDGTARIQTVDPVRNPKFNLLIEAFYKLTGVPVLLNTSFNDRDEPIVCTPEDALACFISTNLDAVVLDNFLILKQPLSTSTAKNKAARVDDGDAGPRWFAAIIAMQGWLLAAFLWSSIGAPGGIVFIAGFLVIGIVYYRSLALRVIAWRWMNLLTYPIRWGLSTFVLAFVYFFVLTPIGSVRRLFGYRPLEAKGWSPFTVPVSMQSNGLVEAKEDVSDLWWLELLQFLQQEKKWWLMPIAVSLIAIAVAASVGGTVAPWIYALW